MPVFISTANERKPRKDWKAGDRCVVTMFDDKDPLALDGIVIDIGDGGRSAHVNIESTRVVHRVQIFATHRLRLGEAQVTGVSIRIEGNEEVGRRLAATAERLEHPRALWEEVGRVGVLQTQERFETEQDPDGRKWPASIRVLVEGGKTMTDSGRLRASITHEASDTGVAIGTNAIQAAIHQFGGRIAAKTAAGLLFRIAGQWVKKAFVIMPRRAFLGVSADNAEELIEIADEYVAEPLGGGTRTGGAGAA